MRTNIFSYLRETSYPGRGILLGRSPDGKYGVAAYFIMGRSASSRNRVFETTENGIKTRAFDPSLEMDPALLIYSPVRMLSDGRVIVTNGDQTDTLTEVLEAGGTVRDALVKRTFEPDDPNWTPRISGVLYPDGAYTLSILKTMNGDPATTCRFFYEYENPEPGTGHFITTYTGDGTPLPSFAGEPIFTDIRQADPRALARTLWEALNDDNRVSLYTAWIDPEMQIVDEVVINARGQADADGEEG